MGGLKPLPNKSPHNLNDVAARRIYSMDPGQIGDFFSLLEECRREQCVLHLAEHITDDPAGLMIDFDRYQYSSEREFKQAHYDAIIEVVVNCIRSLSADLSRARAALRPTNIFDDGALAANESDNSPPAISAAIRATFFFIIRHAPTLVETGSFAQGNAVYKDGIHILIPDVWLPKSARRFIVHKLGEACRSIFMGTKGAESPEKMVDHASPGVPTHFIGSCKVEGIPYHLEYVVATSIGAESLRTVRLPIDELNRGVVSADLSTIMPPGSETQVKQPINVAYEACLTFRLDQIKGVRTWLDKRELELAPEAIAGLERFAARPAAREQQDDDRDIHEQVRDLVNRDWEARILSGLLDILDDSYAVEYDKWLRVLCAVKNTNGKYCPLAKLFSTRGGAKWDPSGFERTWNSLGAAGGTRLTIRSIHFWARECDPARYADIQSRNAAEYLKRQLMRHAGRLEHSHIAEALHMLLRQNYVADVNHGCAGFDQWYEFVSDAAPGSEFEIYKWRPQRSPLSMHLYITHQIPELISKAHRVIDNMYEEANLPEAKKECLKAVLKAINGTELKMYNNSQHMGIIKQAAYIFNVKNFIDSLDQEPFAIGVGNGVLQFWDPQPTWTPKLITTFHELRISKFTKVPFAPYRADWPEARILLKAYHDIYLENDVCDFILLYLSTWLDARDACRRIVLLGGGGRNGKSFSMRMAQAALGHDYVKSLRMQLLTGKREKARDANSALMMLKGARGGYFDEANQGEEINPARMKSIVSPGIQSARELYSTEESFRNTANLVAISNYPFVINSTDNGTWDRVLYYFVKSRFVPNPNPTNPLEKLDDPKFGESRITDMNYCQAMLAILVHYYQILQNRFGGDIGRIPVPTIASETLTFRNSQDPLNKFIVDYFIKAASARTSLRSAIDKYRDWYRRAYQRRLDDDEASLTAAFENSRIGTAVRSGPDSGYIDGFRMKDREGEPIGPGEEPVAITARPRTFAEIRAHNAQWAPLA